MTPATGVAVETKQELDLKVEPDTPEQWAKAELCLEAKIIKTILPSYRNQREAVRKAEDGLAHQLACLKAVRVGRGRDGRWGSCDCQASAADCPYDCWIKDELERETLPEWVTAKLTANKKKKLDVPPPPRYKMMLGLSLVALDDKRLVDRAREQLGKEN
jgi:hypothetical protein